MDINNLIHMANKIGLFFETQPDRDEALSGIAAHIKNVWEPRMRTQLLAYVDKENAKDLIPSVQEALRVHRDNLLPRL